MDIRTIYLLEVTPLLDGLTSFGLSTNLYPLWQYPTEEMRDLFFEGRELSPLAQMALMAFAGLGDIGKNMEAALNQPPLKPAADYSDVHDRANPVNGRMPEPPEPGSLSDVEARQWYLEAEARIPDLIDRSQPLEQQAQQASALRNQFRTQARNGMSNQALAEQLFESNPNMT